MEMMIEIEERGGGEITGTMVSSKKAADKSRSQNTRKHFIHVQFRKFFGTLTLPHRRTFKSLLSLFAGGFLNI
jgi:hypothetical protein